MPIPDIRELLSGEPAFCTVEEFRLCSQVSSYEGKSLPCYAECVNSYRAGDHPTELVDILTDDGGDVANAFPLIPGTYDVMRLLSIPPDGRASRFAHFTMIALQGAEVELWRKVPGGFAADAYNMTVTSADCRRRIFNLIRDCIGDDGEEAKIRFEEGETSDDPWNMMCNMLGEYNEAEYRKFEAYGLRPGTLAGPGAEAVIVHASKVARFFLGYRSNGQELIAIQGRWL